jgi:hypothetical protein
VRCCGGREANEPRDDAETGRSPAINASYDLVRRNTWRAGNRFGDVTLSWTTGSDVEPGGRMGTGGTPVQWAAKSNAWVGYRNLWSDRVDWRASICVGRRLELDEGGRLRLTRWLAGGWEGNIGATRLMALHKLRERTRSVLQITRGECVRCSLGAHVRKTTPDILYGNGSQLRVDGSDDFWVWLLELWPSEPPGEGFGGDWVLCLLDGAGGEVVGLGRCDLEHFLRVRDVLIENKSCREGDWVMLESQRLVNINTGMRTKGSHLEDKTVGFLFRGSV